MRDPFPQTPVKKRKILKDMHVTRQFFQVSILIFNLFQNPRMHGWFVSLTCEDSAEERDGSFMQGQAHLPSVNIASEVDKIWQDFQNLQRTLIEDRWRQWITLVAFMTAFLTLPFCEYFFFQLFGLKLQGPRSHHSLYFGLIGIPHDPPHFSEHVRMKLLWLRVHVSLPRPVKMERTETPWTQMCSHLEPTLIHQISECLSRFAQFYIGFDWGIWEVLCWICWYVWWS